MTSIRDRIAGKQRRRVVVPILLSDPTEDQNLWMGAYTAHEQAKRRDPQDEAEIADLQRQLDEHQERVNAHTVEVELLSLPQGEWEAAQAEWVTESGDSLDWKNALPHLLAASCVDEELQDAEWWTTILAGEAWTEGDLDALKTGLLHINISAPDPRVPKG